MSKLKENKIVKSVLGYEWWKIISKFSVMEVAKLIVLANNKQTKQIFDDIDEVDGIDFLGHKHIHELKKKWLK